MAPAYAQTLLSPAELAYLHSSLSLTPPIRPDSRLPTQFRPLIAETDILPGTNGSARICFADGTEAIVGVKAEVEKSAQKGGLVQGESRSNQAVEYGDTEMGGIEETKRTAVLGKQGAGENSWVEMTIEIPGFRDDDALPVFLAAMLNEALLATGELVDKLWINRRWHWKLYIDVRSSNNTNSSSPLQPSFTARADSWSPPDSTLITAALISHPSPLFDNPSSPPHNPPPRAQIRT